MNKQIILKNQAQINILTTVLNQLVTTACGIVVPRLLIRAFGSEAYGISVSITQFLAYISLLEGGIGGVARGRLYGPLARGDEEQISAVYQAIRRFFRGVAITFLVYSVLLGLAYYDIAKVTLFSREYIFGLVMVIGVTTLAGYMGGLANLTLIVADQKQYINNLIYMLTTIGNTVIVALMVHYKWDLIWVKLGSSVVFLLRPLLYGIYVRRHFKLVRKIKQRVPLAQKWTGIGQHLAYFIHSNTDIVLLTVLSGPRPVAVYAVYNMVIKNIRNITEACVGGMESVFGQSIARKQQSLLRQQYRRYKTIITAVTIVLFSCTGVLIIPFIELYTRGITDANYIQPAFALVLLLAEAINCLCAPCASLPVAAGHLKQTRWGAYGEAIVNVVLSCLLIGWDPLLGVAVGTLAATILRGVYYSVYAARNLLDIPVGKVLVVLFASICVMIAVIFAGGMVVQQLAIENYISWVLCGAVTFVAICLPVLLVARMLSTRIAKAA